MADSDILKMKEMTFGQIVVYFIYIFIIIAEIILGFRFVLLLFGASTDAAFTRWIYETSEVIMAPFRGIFEIKPVGEGTGSYFDFAALFGMLVYLLLGYWLSGIVHKFEKKK